MLSKNFSINDDYKVLLFVKQGFYAETYRVKGNDGKLYFLKLFNYSQLHKSAFDENNNILEIELVKSIQHPNLVTYNDSGEIVIENKKYAYLVLDFIAGETLSEKIIRERYNSLYDIKNLIIGILEGVKYLHQQANPIIHNEITLQNVMLDLAQGNPKPKIIDFGYARGFHQSSKVYNKEGLNPNFLATECFHNIYSPQSDLFSVGIVLYQLVYNSLPWVVDVSKFKGKQSELEAKIVEERKKKIQFPDVSDKIIDFDNEITNIIKKALHTDTEVRFSSADEFIKALKGELKVDDIDTIQIQKSDKEPTKKKATYSSAAKGKGFSAIAGMQDLKNQLQVDVIDALRNPEEYEKYGVTIPNGMLLYGPPGCGKTFFAKHFAEEVGFNFMLIKPSSLKSRYVNATQENIAKMFEEAEENAPTIIFIDEMNELVPNRDSEVHEMAKSAVNEMLAQMDRTGEKGIFIIGATNYPHMIDPAILRAGRLDKKFYLSPPDFEARKAMFEMYLKSRPIDFGMDYEKLTKLTENYVAADIELLVNDASRNALKIKGRITMEILENVIENTKPSVSILELNKYEELRKKMEGENTSINSKTSERPIIGFKK
ncbi:AAA family ATPase [Flavobacterium gawalongense]|uniref:AAA family ATPase n=1 Tax=Flavobacterium gawalongense TaxID=2594432 RepID=A0A553BBI8_9FLAO|nr:AAA family ATPase [Flavobacterium gawalongense]TRW98007.1 AAA family ATPase [Flavobacterium gawalongense]TRX02506.1 AAA family ATPase [Flavobacterium gawalongense]TRX05611.1 AAA family ATPase [Flavobacterium gawalongense]TRX06494.1 AAA family ATPase [Flavobacterium gawalongense]TRX25036.1 AAA family ATPase [Flavobacterium gawalongense]